MEGAPPGAGTRPPDARFSRLVNDAKTGSNPATFSSALARFRRAFRSRFWSTRRRQVASVLVASMLAISIVAGIAWYWLQQGDDEQSYVEIYVTDLPANLTRLDVRVSGVYVGAANHSLHLDQPTFDLRSLHGPEDALRIASGFVPSGNHSDVRIVFQSVRAEINGVSINLDLPGSMLSVSHDFGLGASSSSAILFDFDLDASLKETATGLTFHPVVGSVYVVDLSRDPSKADPTLPGGLPSGLPGGVNPFGGATPQTPRDQGVGSPDSRMDSENPFLPGGGTSSRPPGGGSGSTRSPGPQLSPTPTPTPTGSSSQPPITLPTISPSGSLGLPTPGEGNSIPPGPLDQVGWFVHYSQDLLGEPDTITAQINATGAQVIYTFGSISAAYVLATQAQAEAIAELPDVTLVEPDEAIQVQMASAKVASRAIDVINVLTGIKDALGNVIDGRQVGVGVIDIGFDSLHPDLQHRLINPASPVFEANYKVESFFTIDEPMTDVASGHGTHVAGIVAGRGVMDPTQAGVAPGASLTGFAIGEVSTTLWPNVAFDWLVQNAANQDPPIRVVTNSWGSGTAYEPDSLTTQLVNKLVDQGVVVVFSAGNGGGDGSSAKTTSQCQIPRAGVVCVAAYSDQGTGTRSGVIASYSSRGSMSSPTTWPDISAPGDAIRSTRSSTSTVGGPLDQYVSLSGTSMAAPHVAGVLALMFQANEDLTPAEAQSILESTAYEFSDGGSYGASGHYAKGHGLVDAWAAVTAAKAA